MCCTSTRTAYPPRMSQIAKRAYVCPCTWAAYEPHFFSSRHKSSWFFLFFALSHSWTTLTWRTSTSLHRVDRFYFLLASAILTRFPFAYGPRKTPAETVFTERTSPDFRFADVILATQWNDDSSNCINRARNDAVSVFFAKEDGRTRKWKRHEEKFVRSCNNLRERA